MADNKRPTDERMSRDAHHREGENSGEPRVADYERARDYQQTDPERRRKIRDSWGNSGLPNLPVQNGWHACWVSTTHLTDTVERRKAFGYVLITPDEVKAAGWSPNMEAVKDGEFAGAVRWREMIGMKVPMDLHIDYMREFHLDQPQDQARGILEGIDKLADEVRGKGGRITLDEGMAEMRRRIQTPPEKLFNN